MIFDKRPPPGSAAEIKLEAYESLDDDGRGFINQLAYEIETVFNEVGAEDAKKYMDEAIGGSDEEWLLALWWKLNSKIRSAIKGL